MMHEDIDGIQNERVSDWFSQNIAGVELPLTYELIAGGHSNLTYKVTDAKGNDRVLRRPPLGHVLATAHDMEREHRIISAVSTTDVPVPRTLGVCEDSAVNDAPFYVMEYVEGFVLHSQEDAETVPLEERRALGRAVAEVLGRLHAVEPSQIGLGELGKREDYLGRQLRRWTRQWEQSKTRELKEMEQVQLLLADKKPIQVGATIVHGDYRLGNMLTNSGQILAVLDWELCTLGDPLADVGYLLNNWVSPDEVPAGSSAPTMAGGFASREELLSWYQDETGRDVSGVDYYRAFSYWRLAAIVEGVLNRYLQGAMGDQDDVDTEVFKYQVEHLANSALELLTH
ncbi:MAG: phosphotransferase family protein [Acidimicrobiales bacterium]|jgi:aminoglycoside phosphotransferase (APT) family kinase protein|tara:strand:+ start:1902 stop:2927 length:1026 start_codon:yes stop_codon:yes gene_type:complete